jgi:hypothetical protein
MNFEEYNILGNIINTTWGVGSTNNSKSGTMSIKGQMIDEDRLVLNFTTIITFGEPHERKRELEKASSDSGSILENCIKNIKSAFKEQVGRTLKTKNVDDEEDWELLSLGQYSGRRDAYYRRKIVLELK